MEYKKITQEEFNTILEKHTMWANNKVGGERADLSYVTSETYA